MNKKEITRQLLNATSKAEIDKILDDNNLCLHTCDKEHCLFKELYDYRFDGCCVAQMNDELIEHYIDCIENDIMRLERDIKYYRKKIKRYREYQNKLHEFKEKLK